MSTNSKILSFDPRVIVGEPLLTGPVVKSELKRCHLWVRPVPSVSDPRAVCAEAQIELRKDVPDAFVALQDDSEGFLWITETKDLSTKTLDLILKHLVKVSRKHFRPILNKELEFKLEFNANHEGPRFRAGVSTIG